VKQATEPLLRLKLPKLDEAVVQPLTDDQIRAMSKACRGPDLKDRRDEAILRLMFATGARAGEVVALQTADLNLRPTRQRH
jgi:site-specific recombinase XerD